MSYKAYALASEMANKLQVRTGITCSVTFDSFDSQPVVQIGTPAAGAKAALLKLAEATIGGNQVFTQDSLGLKQKVVAPHVAQLCIEGINFTASATATNAYGQLPLIGGTTTTLTDWSALFSVLGAVLELGTRVELYTIPYGTAGGTSIANVLVSGAMTGSSAAKVASFDNLYNPLTNTI